MLGLHRVMQRFDPAIFAVLLALISFVGIDYHIEPFLIAAFFIGGNILSITSLFYQDID